MRFLETYGRVRTAAVLVLAAILAPAACSAQALEPESGKVITEDAFTVDPGANEIQFAYLHARAGRAFDSGRDLVDREHNRLSAVCFSITQGISERLDAAIALDWADLIDEGEANRRGNGIGNLRFRLKWNFSRRGAWGFTYLGGATAPVGRTADDNDLEIAEDAWSIDQLVAATTSVGRWSASADLGYRQAFWAVDSDNRGGFSANVAAGYQVTNHVQPVLEVNYAHDFVRLVSDPYLLMTTVGAIFNVTGAFRVDLGIQYGILGRNSDRAVVTTVNLSYTL